MIVRTTSDGWLLISQVEHARIAAEIAGVWRLSPVLAGLGREFQHALAHHDDGWREWEHAPTIDADGRPRDFMEMPMPVATHLWSSSILVAAHESPWCGLWVSRHFCHLAELAIQHRDDPQDQAAARQFVDNQTRRQQEWRNSAGPEATADGTSPVEIAGLHGLQFFDRLSLWLCCAERTQPLEIDDPAGATTRWEPLAAGPIRVFAAGWSVPKLTVSVPTIAVAQRTYSSDADLGAAMADGERGSLSWTLVRGEEAD